MEIDKHKLVIAEETFSRYEEDVDLVWFNVIHIYPDYSTKLENDDCYHDSLKFKAVVYSTEDKLFKELGNCHDAIELTDHYTNDSLPLDRLQIYCDGSTVIGFKKKVRLATNSITQVIDLTTK